MRRIAFKDFVTLQRGFDLPRSEMAGGIYPVVGSTSIIGFHSQYKVEPPGVVTGRSGSLGEVQFVAQPYWPHNTALWVRDFRGNVPKYVYYFLKTLDLGRFNSGAGVPTLNRNHLDKLEISVHEIEAQRDVATILTGYDDLIEVNTRRIRILEQMAQAVYREWFGKVDLESLPEGCKVVDYADLLESYSGGDWGVEEPDEKEYCRVVIIRGTDFNSVRDGGLLQAPRRYVSARSLERRRLRAGDIVVENSVNASSRSAGTALLMTGEIIDRIGEDAICASFCKNFRLKQSELAPLVYMHMKYLYQENRMPFYQHVATNGIGNFQAERFVRTEHIVVPTDKSLLASRLETLRNLTASVYAGQIANLRRTRDLLLPRLVSGEVSVEVVRDEPMAS
jgi:type I restriction enzyme S subunit